VLSWKVITSRTVKKFSQFTEPKISWQCSQNPANGLHKLYKLIHIHPSFIILILTLSFPLWIEFTSCLYDLVLLTEIYVIYLFFHNAIFPANLILLHLIPPHNNTGASGGAVGWGTALQAGRSRVRFPVVSLDFFIDIILPAALWPWGWLSLWQKWMECFLGVRAAGV